MKIAHSLMGAVAGILLVSGAALAQAPADAGAAPPAAPKAPDVKTIGDWAVRCFPVNSPSPCDVYQELDDQRTHQRVLSLSIAYIPSLDRHALMVTVPLEVAIPKGVVIKTDSFTSQPLRYRRCDRMGCYVEMAIENGAIESMAKSGPDAAVQIVADNGKPYNLKFSLKGFAAAHDQMVGDAKAKAKPIQKPADGGAAPAAPAATP
jgi:invasion protein IalB